MRHDIPRLTDEERHVLMAELTAARGDRDLKTVFEVADIFYTDAFSGYIEASRELHGFALERDVTLSLVARIYSTAQEIGSYLTEMDKWRNYAIDLRRNPNLD